MMPHRASRLNRSAGTAPFPLHLHPVARADARLADRAGATLHRILELKLSHRGIEEDSCALLEVVDEEH